jgi:hypothetical protein
MPATPSAQDHNISEQLAAIDHLIEDAKRLRKAQEREVERLHAAGLDTRSAEGLLDAYRAGARIATERKRSWKRSWRAVPHLSGGHDRSGYQSQGARR